MCSGVFRILKTGPKVEVRVQPPTGGWVQPPSTETGVWGDYDRKCKVYLLLRSQRDVSVVDGLSNVRLSQVVHHCDIWISLVDGNIH